MLLPTQRILEKHLNSRLVTSCILTCSLAVTTAAWAGYKPPTNQKPPSSKTTSTVSRSGGCRGNSGTTLTALAPSSHVGHTASTHPTFAWFVPDSQSYPVEFRLYQYEPNGDRTRIQAVMLQSQPGIMSLSLPKEQPGLTVGQRYRWQVVIFCNPNRPSSALVAEADIDVVEMPPALVGELSATSNSLERADLYAESGLWYDALGEALAATQEFQLTLLEELARLEEITELAEDSTQSTRIRQILEANGNQI